jgi:hypothetical protein
MPRFFFDIDDGEERSPDSEGVELPDLEEVRKKAIGVLPDLAREELPDGDRRVFVCQARDESGTVVFIATLSLVAEWVRHRHNRRST